MAHASHVSAAGGARNTGRIDVTAPQEVQYWTERLQVSEEALRTAVAEVGVATTEVCEHLGMAPRAAQTL